jgi:hypothetical protein
MFMASTLKDAASIRAFALAFAAQMRAAFSRVIARVGASSECRGPLARPETYEVSPLPTAREVLDGAYQKVDVARSWLALYS